MGLDMYLHAKRYLTPLDSVGSELLEKVKSLNIVPTDFEPSTITYSIAYWRKANAIHKWFVDNVQEGNDDCEEYDVSTSKLKVLYNLCCQVRDNREKASELLPTESGFFFGSTEYDEFYYEDINNTIAMLGKFLACDDFKKGFWYFTYRASW